MFTRKTHHWGWSPWEWIHFRITFKPWPNETESWWELTLALIWPGTLTHSRLLTSTLENSHRIWTCMLTFFMIVGKSFVSLGRARECERELGGQQLPTVSNYCFFFSAGTDWNGKIIWRRTRGPRTTPRLLKKKKWSHEKILHHLT